MAKVKRWRSGPGWGIRGSCRPLLKDYALFMSRRLIALFALPAVLLGGCQTVTSLGDHTAATLGLEDEPKSYTASVVSQPKRTGIAVAAVLRRASCVAVLMVIPSPILPSARERSNAAARRTRRGARSSR